MEKLSPELEKNANKAIIKVFIVVVAGIFALIYLTKLIPSQQASCNKTCSFQGKRGQLIVKDASRYTGNRPAPKTCECI